MELHGTQVPTVNVRAANDGPAVVLTPLDAPSEELLASLLAELDQRTDWHSHGSVYKTPFIKDVFIGIFVAAGGVMGRRTEGNTTFTIYNGAVNFYLSVSDDTDEDSRYRVRDYGYYCGWRVSPDSTPQAVHLMANQVCKVCEGVLGHPSELEWRVCNRCAAVCQHVYKEGVGQAGGKIVCLPFCEICGRGDPNWRPSEDPEEDLVNTVARGHLDALLLNHPDGGSTLLTKRRDSDPAGEDDDPADGEYGGGLLY